MNQSKLFLLLTCALALMFPACKQGEKEMAPTDTLAAKTIEKIEGEEIAELTSPPFVPKPITREHATKVIVNLEIIEKEMRLTDGATYMFWTFGGTVPGKFIRVREGDFVEFHLKNHPDNRVPHNIDLHAVTGAGGGAEASFTAPGHESIFSFTALNPGLFVYHCATAPVGMHIANGMYGLILVEPKTGMAPVDREYYVMQGDFYTKGATDAPGFQPFDMEKAMKEQPDYVVFNGSVGALTGDKSLKARTGERIRLFVGNGGPNMVSSFHLIGEIFDNVYAEGGSMVNHHVQTTLIPSGGAAIAEFRVEVPSKYILVDHSIFRAFNKGALATLEVEGPENDSIYSGKQNDLVYQPEGGAIQSMPFEEGTVTEAPVAQNKAERVAAGAIVYSTTCLACHQADGKGVPNAFPPLASSDYLNADPRRAVSAAVHGLSGKIRVNGVEYNGIMPRQNLSDEQVANVVTYVLNNFGNKGGEITPAQVAAIRKK